MGGQESKHSVVISAINEELLARFRESNVLINQQEYPDFSNSY